MGAAGRREAGAWSSRRSGSERRLGVRLKGPMDMVDCLMALALADEEAWWDRCGRFWVRVLWRLEVWRWRMSSC